MANTNNTFCNRMKAVRATKDDKTGAIRVLGAFSCGINFPRDDSKPFKVVERQTQNGKTYKQVSCTVVLTPDYKKSDKGNPFNGIYVNGKNQTLAELLAAENVELFNGKLYASVSMNRQTEGLHQVLSDPKLTYQTDILVCGELSIYTGRNDGKRHVAFGNVTFFGKDHVYDDKTEKENLNCQLSEDGASSGGKSGQASGGSAGGSSVPSGSNGDFALIPDDDDELPF